MGRVRDSSVTRLLVVLVALSVRTVAWHWIVAPSCSTSGSWRPSSPSQVVLATNVAARTHKQVEGEWCRKTVGYEEWPEYVDCHENPVPEFVPAKFCQLLYRRGPGGVLVVGDSLSGLFAATLVAMLADHAGPETASHRAYALWPICSNRTLEFVRNDPLDTAPTYAGRGHHCGPTYHGVFDLHCNPWADRVAASAIVVLNTGAHAGFGGSTHVTLEMFRDMMSRAAGRTRELAQVADFPPRLFYRTSPAGHPVCSSRSRPFESAAEANASFRNASRDFDWAAYAARNALARQIFRPLGFTLLDIEVPTSMRLDRHQVDCLHYCRPWPSMLWVQLMYAALLDEHAATDKPVRRGDQPNKRFSSQKYRGSGATQRHTTDVEPTNFEIVAEPTRLLVSINVHEAPAVVLAQLSNIRSHLQMELTTVLNCNARMLYNLSKHETKLRGENVRIHPVPLEKARYSGSLFQGLVSNLMLMHDEGLTFDFVLVLSSRIKFVEQVGLDDFKSVMRRCSAAVQSIPRPAVNITYGHTLHRFHFDGCKARLLEPWYWNTFERTQLAQHVAARHGLLIGGWHEGFVMHWPTAVAMINFLRRHPKLAQNLFVTQASIEEFAPFTLTTLVEPKQPFGSLNFIVRGQRAGKLVKVRRTVSDF